MDCMVADKCGGCSFRHLENYRQYKTEQVKKILQPLISTEDIWAEPIFIKEGCRRRASFTFLHLKGKILLGFNGFHSNEIIDLCDCPQLTPKINRNLEFLRNLLNEICHVCLTVKNARKKKTQTAYVEKGDLWITDTENGLDVVLEFPFEPNLEMREIIFEKINANEDIVRISHRKSVNKFPETIIEKGKPYITCGDIKIFVPAGTFLQPSKEGQQALTDEVLKYLGNTKGEIADLFCGVGTFSYPLSQDLHNKILAVDSSEELLSGFKSSINHRMITNIEILNRNLFKYPLEEKELSSFTAVVFDPPRAGAKEQVKILADMEKTKRPHKLIAVSCNPETFVRDAEILQNGGYHLKKITMVDQFIYTRHTELVALFED